MSTMKIVALSGVFLLIGGCALVAGAPVTGVKSVAAFIFSFAAAAGAWFGILRDKHEVVVCSKANALDEAVTILKAKHQPSEDSVVELSPSHKWNGLALTQMRNGIAAPNTVKRLNDGL